MKCNKRMFMRIESCLAGFICFMALFLVSGVVKSNKVFGEPNGVTIFVSPEGGGTGESFESPVCLEEAIKRVTPGDCLLLTDGVYELVNTVSIGHDKDGTAENRITMRAEHPGRVVLDFSKQPFDGNKRGVVLEANYWHMLGIDIKGAGDNGMLLAGNYNIIERCNFYENRDSGLQISRNNSKYTTVSQWPSYNLILNCSSFNNADPDNGEDADGFAAKLTCGEGNVFFGCMSYNNVDDGWDLYAKSSTGAIGRVYIIHCIAFRNGQTEAGVCTEGSDGNGFKLGGGGVGAPHVVLDCLAFENKNTGFTDNNNPEALSLINCTAINNNRGTEKKPNYRVYRCKDATFENLLSFYSDKKMDDDFQNGSGAKLLYSKGKTWNYIDEFGIVDTKKTDCSGKALNFELSEAEFKSVTAPEVGTDFNKLWRDSDGFILIPDFGALNEASVLGSMGENGERLGADFSQSDYLNLSEEIWDKYITGQTRELIRYAENRRQNSEIFEEEQTGAWQTENQKAEEVGGEADKEIGEEVGGEADKEIDEEAGGETNEEADKKNDDKSYEEVDERINDEAEDKVGEEAESSRETVQESEKREEMTPEPISKHTNGVIWFIVLGGIGLCIIAVVVVRLKTAKKR